MALEYLLKQFEAFDKVSNLPRRLPVFALIGGIVTFAGEEALGGPRLALHLQRFYMSIYRFQSLHKRC